jgi:uncharacterized protein with HEPN domain/predicted nucleotidyltransferase
VLASIAVQDLTGIDRERIANLCRRHGIRRLSLFGSALRGDLLPGSDLDVLVEFLPGAAVGLRFITIQDELEDLFGRPIDLNTPAFLSRHFRERVLHEARALCARPPEDDVLLRDMLDHARKAVAAVAGRERGDLDRDDVLAAALERFIEVLGEAAGKVSEATREHAATVPWRGIIGMRNRLVHGYASVDHDIVWDVVTDDLPRLIADLESLLEPRG